MFFFAVNRDPLPKLQIAGAPLAAKTICNLFDQCSHLFLQGRNELISFLPHFCTFLAI
jgi:hypothetical protein